MKRLVMLTLVFTLVLSVGCGWGGQGNSPLNSPNPADTSPSKIAFSSDRDGQGLMALYTMNWDGSEQTKVPLPPVFTGQAWDPAVSSNGSRIVFSYNGSQYTDLYLVNPNGSNLVQLTSDTVNYSPQFSPDGSKIVFIRELPGNIPHIWIMNADGSNQRDLTPDSPHEYDSAVFSPDGTKIVATRDNNPDPTGTNQGAITRIQPALAAPEPGQAIVSMNLDGSSETILATEVDENGLAQFSPNKQSLIFSARLTKNAVVSERLTDASRSVLTPTDSDNYDPLVLGEYVFFVSMRDGNSAVYRMNPDGSNQVRLTDPAQNSSLGRAVH